MKEIFFFLILTFVVFGIDYYAYQAFKTLFPLQTLSGKIVAGLYWSITLFIIISIVVTAMYGQQNIPKFLKMLTAAIFFFGLLSKIFAITWLFGEDVFRSISFAFKKLSSQSPTVQLEDRRKFISQMAILSAFVPFLVLSYGVLRNAYNYQFHKINLSLKKLPKNFKGFTIVQLSDIHSGSFNQTKPIQKAIDKINALNPDLIVFTGDLVNDLAEEMDEYKAIFSQLKAKHGVFSVLGNHDYGAYAFGSEDSPEKRANFEAFLKVHQDMGWDLIRNSNRILEIDGERISLIGVENWSVNSHFPSGGDMKKAYEGIDPNSLQILLSHDPSHWDAQVRKEYPNVDLMLSGHTHGFQFGIETKWFKWSPSQYAYKQWAGLYQEAEQFLYVNRGFGNLGYPGRVGILPEVTVITLT
ncbi:MAG: metallophosphoesterase [Chitinophagales bacterium]